MFLCPVRSRPHLLSFLLPTWVRNSHYPLTVLIGHDDPSLENYLSLIEDYSSFSPLPITHYIYPQVSRGTLSALNHYFYSNPSLGYYGFIGEDCQLLTSNFPLIPLANYFAVAWPDDGFAHAQMCTHPVLGGELVRAVGHLAPPWFHSFFDNYWMSIGQALQVLHYCPVVEYNHNQYQVQATSPDAINDIAAQHYQSDEDAFREWHFGPGKQSLIDRINPQEM